MSKNKSYLFTEKLWHHIKDTSIAKKCRFVSHKGELFEVTKDSPDNFRGEFYSVENIYCVAADEIDETED